MKRLISAILFIAVCGCYQQKSCDSSPLNGNKNEQGRPCGQNQRRLARQNRGRLYRRPYRIQGTGHDVSQKPPIYIPDSTPASIRTISTSRLPSSRRWIKSSMNPTAFSPQLPVETARPSKKSSYELWHANKAGRDNLRRNICPRSPVCGQARQTLQ